MEENHKQPKIIPQIKMIDNLVKKYGDIHLKKIDLTFSQATILIFLDRERLRTIQQQDIEKALNLTNPTVSGLLRRLEEKGFIIRRKQADDHRAMNIFLTEKAEQIIDSIHQNVKFIESLLFEGLSIEEIETLHQLINKVARNAFKHL